MERAIAIRKANDLARTAMGIASMLVMTRGVMSLPQKAQSKIREQVELFDHFTEDNDPYKEHDFGSFTYDDEETVQKIFWKIDYYDRSLTCGADPLDPNCRRVLTIMLAEEY